MSLSCHCDWDDSDWWFSARSELSPLSTARARRCCACKTPIKPGEDSLMLDRWRASATDIEDRIYGDEVPLAARFLCASRGWLFLAIDELGMCCDINQPLAEQTREFAYEAYGLAFADPPAAEQRNER